MNESEDKREFEDKHHALLNLMPMQELLWLNEMLIDRIKLLEELDYMGKTRLFRRGDKVSWTKDHFRYEGQVFKVNRKTISVTETKSPYRQWKIDPNFLYKE